MKFLSLFILFVAVSKTAFSYEFILSATGDLNFTQNNLSYGHSVFHPDRAHKHGHWLTWEETTSYVYPFFEASDLNFTNVETVVTDDIRKIRPRKSSGFVFASHVNGIKHLVDNLDFNLFALSNNHAYDYGQKGMEETKRSFDEIKSRNPDVHYAGIDFKDQAYKPIVFEKKGLTIAFASISGVGSFSKPSDTKVSQVDYRKEGYFKLLDQFAKTQADLKILSIHYGTEKQVDLNRGQKERFRLAVERGGVDVVIGHHPHVVRPVEMYKGSVIFYSLGNFLMFGAANIDKKSSAKNYGALGKVYFNVQEDALEVSAVEMVALNQLHKQPRPLLMEEGQKRMQALNKVTQRNLPQTGLIFESSLEGTGVSCFHVLEGTEASKACQGLPFRL